MSRSNSTRNFDDWFKQSGEWFHEEEARESMYLAWLMLDGAGAELACVLRYEMSLTISTYERATNPRRIPTHVALLMEAYDAGYRPKDWPV